jgi:hypothetical protein
LHFFFFLFFSQTRNKKKKELNQGWEEIGGLGKQLEIIKETVFLSLQVPQFFQQFGSFGAFLMSALILT